ncbi:MAG: iron donor protein CyaY [Rickettsiales bacterium]|nr:iron donor protein CyaY [Rickettsiales bacterium]
MTLDILNFHEKADEILEEIFSEIDAIADENNLETDLLNGVLSIKTEDNGEYIINKHEPTKQIWFSSPFSGASRFNFDETKQQWVNDIGEPLSDFLHDELKELAYIIFS